MPSLNALHTLPATVKPASGLYARGKSLVSFYKTGITNVWRNRQIFAELHRKYAVKTLSDLARSVLENSHLAEISQKVRKSSSAPKISVTRSELLTAWRTEPDLRKLPVFAVVFAVCFEFTPLVLWGVPRLAPSTCWSAKYTAKRQKQYEQERKVLNAYMFSGSESVHQLSGQQLRQLAIVLDLGQFSKLVPPLVLQKRLEKHMLLVRADDAILRQNSQSLSQLDAEELVRALMMRGLPIDGGLRALKWWIAEFKEPMDAGFFGRDVPIDQ